MRSGEVESWRWAGMGRFFCSWETSMEILEGLNHLSGGVFCEPRLRCRWQSEDGKAKGVRE